MAKGEYPAFERKREFLLCADMEGSVLNMLVKQQEEACFPALTEVYHLTDQAEKIRPIWMKTSLDSRLRGENRFRILAQFFIRLESSGITVPGMQDLLYWVESGSELTHGALAARVKRGAKPDLKRVLEWSREVNHRIASLPKTYSAADGAKKCLEQARTVADLVAVSTGTPAAVRSAWLHSGLSDYADTVIASQQDKKSTALIPVFGAGYLPSHMLFVGDTLGDAIIAEESGALFFPILPGSEAACWQRLNEEGIPKFLHGSFAGSYEERLLAQQRALLA